MKHFATLIIFLFFTGFCTAREQKDTLYVDIASINQDSSLLAKTQYFIDSSSTLTANNVLSKSFDDLKNFKYRKKLPLKMATYSFFLKIPVSNSSAFEKTVYLYPGALFKQIELYKIPNTTVKLENNDQEPGYHPITLAPGEKVTLLARLNPLKHELIYITPVLINTDYLNNYQLFIIGHKHDLQHFSLLLCGVLLMMLLFTLTNLIINGKPEFLYSTLYSCCMFLLVFLNSNVARTTSHFTQLYYSYLDLFLLVIGTICFIVFTRKFINTPVKYIQLDRFLSYSQRFLLLLMGIYTYLNFFTNTYLPQLYLENFMKLLILGIGIVFIVQSLKKRDRLLNFIAAGNTMLVLFSFVSLILIWLSLKSHSLFLSSLFYYYLGILFELTFFMLGLNYKNKMELITNIKEQEAMKQEAEKKSFEMRIAIIKAQQEERNRISADMHDDLGAGMTTISLYSELAKTKLAHINIPEINKISTAANELLSKMNAIIWSMNNSNDTLNNMIAYIRSYALEYFEETGIECKINTPEKLPNIVVMGIIRRNVFLLVKEALNNILKHAKATKVTISLQRIDDYLILYIHDNGIGINLDNIRQFGNGLKNMKKRMNDIEVEFNIENKNGTLITLKRKVKQF